MTPYYLGLEEEKEGVDSISITNLEKAELEAERRLRNAAASKEFKEKFYQKKRRRIELLQTQDKEVLLSDLSLDEFQGLFSNKPSQKPHQEEPKPKSILVMETVAKPKELEEKSTEELIRILQEKKKKLLLLQYASKELAE